MPVELNHVYIVRTIDEDSALFAAFRVTRHRAAEPVLVQWILSPEDDRFVLPPGCPVPHGPTG